MRSGETRIALTYTVTRIWSVRVILEGEVRRSLGKGEEARFHK